MVMCSSLATRNTARSTLVTCTSTVVQMARCSHLVPRGFGLDVDMDADADADVDVCVCVSEGEAIIDDAHQPLPPDICRPLTEESGNLVIVELEVAAVRNI